MAQGKRPSRMPKRARGFAEYNRQRGEYAKRDAWWYEDENGISVHCEPAGSRVISVEIPWAALMRAARRCGAVLDSPEGGA